VSAKSDGLENSAGNELDTASFARCAKTNKLIYDPLAMNSNCRD
jgi:hypothetical protein